MLKTLALAAFVFVAPVVAPVVAMAQDAVPQNARTTYGEARQKMDDLIMQRRMGDAIRIFDGLGEPSNKELAAIDAKMSVLYKENFTDVALVRSDLLKNGFRQEIIAYWAEDQYLFVYLLMHTADNRARLLNFRFDNDFHTLNALF